MGGGGAFLLGALPDGRALRDQPDICWYWALFHALRLHFSFFSMQNVHEKEPPSDCLHDSFLFTQFSQPGTH